MNYKINIEIFKTIDEYQFKHPNYFKQKTLINDKVTLEDFFYETYDDMNCSYRVSFQNLS